MIEFAVTEERESTWIALKGRIDSMTAPEIQEGIDDLIHNGHRALVVDFHEVHYVSSAGLRVFLLAQKQLKKVGGEIIIYRIPASILSVFKMSGFETLFKFLSTNEEVKSVLGPGAPGADEQAVEIRSIHFRFIEGQTGPGMLSVIGSEEKLRTSQYTEEDVYTVKAQQIPFGTGLATIGDNYDDYKSFFGESVIIDRSLFFYPAVKRPSVDFMLCPKEEPALEYRFLHGFGFSGPYSYILSFEDSNGLIPFTDLAESLLEISAANLIGVVLLAESKGLWGMHLKRVPISENRPKNGQDVLDPDNFSEWMNFPVEPSDIGHVIVGTGLAVADRAKLRPEVRALIPADSSIHFHGAVFSKAPLSKQVDQFEGELKRVLAELDVHKVNHILGQTRLGSGLAGVIVLEK